MWTALNFPKRFLWHQLTNLVSKTVDWLHILAQLFIMNFGERLAGFYWSLLLFFYLMLLFVFWHLLKVAYWPSNIYIYIYSSGVKPKIFTYIFRLRKMGYLKLFIQNVCMYIHTYVRTQTIETKDSWVFFF